MVHPLGVGSGPEEKPVMGFGLVRLNSINVMPTYSLFQLLGFVRATFLCPNAI